jgi:hypothetical protein
MEQRLLAGLDWMRPNTTRVMPLCNRARSRVERDCESIPTGHRGPANIDAPFPANNAIKIVDDRAVASKQSSPLINESHAIHPDLLSFGDRRPLPSDLADVVNEFGDVPMRRRAAGPGRLRSRLTRPPLPTILRGWVAAGIMHKYP